MVHAVHVVHGVEAGHEVGRQGGLAGGQGGGWSQHLHRERGYRHLHTSTYYDDRNWNYKNVIWWKPHNLISNVIM